MPEHEPLVSVLMPVYNGEKYLKEAIQSILDQTFSDFEFLIINDGSTDRSEEIINSFSDKRIRYVKNEKNLKIIDTLNKGLELSKGKYVARMDADDISVSNRFEKQVVFMESNPDYGLCGSDIEVMDEKNGNARSWIKVGDHPFIKFWLLLLNPICHPTVFIRKSVVQSNDLRYEKKYLHAEEYGLWAKISKFSKLHNLPDKLLKYRIHGSQISSVFSDIQQETVNKIKNELLSELFIFTTSTMKRRQLVMTDLGLYSFVDADGGKSANAKGENFLESGFRNRFRLWIWLNLMKISLLFKREWNSTYIQNWITKSKNSAAKKSRLFRL